LEGGSNRRLEKTATCTLYQILLGWLNQRGWDGQNM
jgi:hypothetical protein